jgi:S-adenosylmethionine hydrolase
MVQITTKIQRHKDSRKFIFICVLVSLWLISTASAGTVVFMSDFGDTDDSVAICKGVMLRIDPDTQIIDITHKVTPYSILDGARYLAGTTPYFPAGTVFLVVVDPGVGSTRKPVVIKSKKGQYFVLPDNGLITMLENQDGIEAIREIKNTSWMIGTGLSSTFHGRDIFSPVAAHLAKGEDWTAVGPESKQIVRLPIPKMKSESRGIAGQIIGLDGPYGNLITNITADDFSKLNYKVGEKIHTRIGERNFEIPFVKTFSDVMLHSSLAYVDSRGRLAFAINQGNFAAKYKITPPQPIFVSTK